MYDARTDLIAAAMDGMIAYLNFRKILQKVRPVPCVAFLRLCRKRRRTDKALHASVAGGMLQAFTGFIPAIAVGHHCVKPPLGRSSS